MNTPIIAGVIGGEERSKGKMIKLVVSLRRLYHRRCWAFRGKKSLLLYTGPVFVGVYW